MTWCYESTETATTKFSYASYKYLSKNIPTHTGFIPVAVICDICNDTTSANCSWNSISSHLILQILSCLKTTINGRKWNYLFAPCSLVLCKTWGILREIPRCRRGVDEVICCWVFMQRGLLFVCQHFGTAYRSYPPGSSSRRSGRKDDRFWTWSRQEFP